MSVLQEYAEIRNRIGEARYNEITAFLEANPEFDLSDVYYNPYVHAMSVQWTRDTFGKTVYDEPNDNTFTFDIVADDGDDLPF